MTATARDDNHLAPIEKANKIVKTVQRMHPMTMRLVDWMSTERVAEEKMKLQEKNFHEMKRHNFLELEETKRQNLYMESRQKRGQG